MGIIRLVQCSNPSKLKHQVIPFYIGEGFFPSQPQPVLLALEPQPQCIFSQLPANKRKSKPKADNICVAAASVLPEISEFRERVLGRSGNRFRQRSSHVRDGYRYRIPMTGSSGFARMEDTAASGCYQNTISRMGGHDLLSQK